jgi:hypothetical protein
MCSLWCCNQHFGYCYSDNKLRKTRISSTDTERNTLHSIKEHIALISKELAKKQQNFDLMTIDKEIRDLKHERNSTMYAEKRKELATAIKSKKETRWTEFHEIEVTKRQLKDKRRENYCIRQV